MNLSIIKDDKLKKLMTTINNLIDSENYNLSNSDLQIFLRNIIKMNTTSSSILLSSSLSSSSSSSLLPSSPSLSTTTTTLFNNKLLITKNFDVDNSIKCGGVLTNVISTYSNYYHPYCAIVVCIFGSVANILNIAILTRKEMATAPINRILTALAVADMLLMIEYIPFAYYYYLILLGKMDFPYLGAVYMLFHTHITQILHTISICLTLTLAIWRYLAIGYPERSQILCSDKRCKLAIILSYFIPILLCIPSYFALTITSKRIIEDKIYILYHTDLSDIYKRNKTLLQINFWIYAVFIKLLPCILLTVISCWLIRTLFKAKKRKQVLRGYDSYPLTIPLSLGRTNITTPSISTTSTTAATTSTKLINKKFKSERRAERTTKMLIAVLLLFLLTEFPQGIFAFLIGLKGKYLFLECYQLYGELMDILALINGSINFLLYCFMNRMFRATFGQIFKKELLSKWTPSPSEMHTTSFINGTNTTEL